MAIIPHFPGELRQARKTLTFDGGAGSGAVGTGAVFTTTGRVLVHRITAWCSVNLTDSGATADLSIGTSSAASAFLSVTQAAGVAAGEFLDNYDGGGSEDAFALLARQASLSVWAPYSISNNIIFTVADEAITAGTVIVDIWYTPITDDGALSGDDHTALSKNVYRRNTAQAGASSTITLDSGASAIDDFYNDAFILLLEGTGASGVRVPERLRRITDYVGSTKVATVDAAWGTTPSSDTVFLIMEAS